MATIVGARSLVGVHVVASDPKKARVGRYSQIYEGVRHTLRNHAKGFPSCALDGLHVKQAWL